MGWQADITSVVCELDSESCPIHKRALISIPRQQGKTWLARVLVLATEEYLPAGSLIGYTAQSRMSAAARVVEAGTAFVRAGIPGVKVLRGIGGERIEFENGTNVIPISPSDTAGAGYTFDFLIVDELWAVSEMAMGAILPAVIARPTAQIIAISTMGDLDSTVMNRWVAQGRDGDIAYWEWSIPEGRDIFDEDEWWEAMPSLGQSVEVDAIRTQRAGLDPRMFEQMFANRVVTTTQASAIPPEWWADTEGPPEAIPAELVLGIDVGRHGEVSTPAIVGAWTSGGETPLPHLELIDWREGAEGAWLIKRVEDLIGRFRIRAISLDPSGPAVAYVNQIRAMCERRGIVFRAVTRGELVGGVELLYSSLRDRALTHGAAGPFDEAAAAAVRKEMGDRWIWSRKSPVSLSPLFAATLAIEAWSKLQTRPRVAIY